MAPGVFPKHAFPCRVFPMEVFQGKGGVPERDGTWASALPSGFNATARALPGAGAGSIPVQPSARAATTPGYYAENEK